MILTGAIRLPSAVIESLSADDIRWLEHEVSLRMMEKLKHIAGPDYDAATNVGPHSVAAGVNLGAESTAAHPLGDASEDPGAKSP